MSNTTSSSRPSRQIVRDSMRSSLIDFCDQSLKLILTPVLKPASYGKIFTVFACASPVVNSSVLVLTSMSCEDEATVDHLVEPVSMLIAKLCSLRVTLCFLPAMIQFPPSCKTVTGMPPH